FFKVMGPAAAVAEHKEAFDTFLRSVRFTGKADEPVTWTVPPGWREERAQGKDEQVPGRELYATLFLGAQEQPLRLTVTPLAAKGVAADVLENVNRWRRQLGLNPVGRGDLDRVTTRLKVGDAVATVVDIASDEGGLAPPPARDEGLT